MRPIKNKRRRDPRYFLHESIDPDNDGSLDPEELRNLAADLEGDEDIETLKSILQHDYNDHKPVENIDAKLRQLELNHPNDYEQLMKLGSQTPGWEITDKAQEILGIKVETPAPQYGAKDPRTARMRVATSGWHGSLVAPKEMDPQGRGWDRD